MQQHTDTCVGRSFHEKWDRTRQSGEKEKQDSKKKENGEAAIQYTYMHTQANKITHLQVTTVHV